MGDETLELLIGMKSKSFSSACKEWWIYHVIPKKYHHSRYFKI